MKAKFTLVEILTVVSIMIVILSLLVSSATHYLQKVRAKKAHIMIHQINFAIQSYNNDYGTYFPVDVRTSIITANLPKRISVSPTTLTSSTDYLLPADWRQYLYVILTGQNPRQYNYLPDMSLNDNNELENPWGGVYEFAINNPYQTGTISTNLNHNDHIDLDIITDVAAKTIIKAFSMNTSATPMPIPPKKDHIIYTITPSVVLSNLNNNITNFSSLTNGCIHSLKESFE